MTASHPSASFSATLRVRLENQPGTFARLAEAIGEAGGLLGAIDLVRVERGTKIRDVTVLANDAALRARDVRAAGSGMRFTLVVDGADVCEVDLPVPGDHNVLNALAAIGAARAAGCDPARAARALESFEPAGRRFEAKGEAAGVRVFDDYAHHATEVAATLAAARALEPRRLVAVFQPHLYSRTAHTHRDLGRALAGADVVVVLDVYRAREHPEDYPGVDGALVARAADAVETLVRDGLEEVQQHFNER